MFTPSSAADLRCSARFRERGQPGGHAVLAECAFLAERTRAVVSEITLLSPKLDSIKPCAPDAGGHRPRVRGDRENSATRPVCALALERLSTCRNGRAIPGQDRRETTRHPPC